MARFRLNLCGDFRLTGDGGEPVPLAGRKAQALLAYLALTPGRAHSREHLATLLWGERMDEQARQSLRQALSALRRALGEDSAVLHADGDGVFLEADVFTTDVAEFHTLSAVGTPQALEQAVALTAEPLLRGFTTGEDGFDLWLAGERDRLRSEACTVLERLSARRVEDGDRSAAIEAAQRLVALDPLHESGHRLLMRLYVEDGRRTEALRQFQACAEALRRELAAEPDAETRRLHDEIRAGAGQADEPTRPALPDLALPPADAPLTFGEPPPLPDIPSLAVLPFENLSGDPEQTYFSDGITEDIIVDLVRISGMLVIDRHASFAYRDKSVPLAQIGKELGVRTILEGTVRRAGDRIRITARLLEAATGRPLWAERYDRDLADVFQVQDEITAAIVTELSVKLVTGEMGRSWRTAFRNREALERFYQGVQWHHLFTPDSLRQAVEAFQDVLRHEPGSLIAWVYLAYSNVRLYTLGLADAPAAWDAFTAAVSRARALAPEHPQVLAMAATMHLFRMEFDEALEASARAMETAPNSEETCTVHGFVCAYSGRPQEALEALARARRLRPTDWPIPLSFLATSLRELGRFDESIATAKHCSTLFPDFWWVRINLAVTYGLLERWAEAEAEVCEVLAVNPLVTIDIATRTPAYRDPERREQVETILRRAGLPD